MALTIPPALITPRLLLRPFVEDDFEPFYASCLLDPRVMAFYHAFRAPYTSTERRARARRDFLDRFLEGSRRYGYICWTLRPGPGLHAPPDPFLGWCGVLSPALEHDRWGPELSYMLAPGWQGRGLATEAAAAVMADAWTRFHLTRMHAVVDPPNHASQRVLERVGMRLEGPVDVYGGAGMLLYTIEAPVDAA
jgi:RimJ/RimL family protein N-acetyltransferase